MVINIVKKCSNCGYIISYGVYSFSKRVIGKPLCRLCQIDGGFVKDYKISKISIKLCKKFRSEGINCTLEKKVDNYRADLYFEDIGLVFEIDGDIHYFSVSHLIGDMRKTMYYFEQGLGVIRIPNYIIERDFNKAFNILKSVYLTFKKEIEETEEYNPKELKKKLIESLRRIDESKFKRYNRIINQSEECNIHIDTLNFHYCKRFGHKWTADEEKLVEELFFIGFSFNELSILFERHPKTIKGKLRKLKR